MNCNMQTRTLSLAVIISFVSGFVVCGILFHDPRLMTGRGPFTTSPLVLQLTQLQTQPFQPSSVRFAITSLVTPPMSRTIIRGNGQLPSRDISLEVREGVAEPMHRPEYLIDSQAEPGSSLDLSR